MATETVNINNLYREAIHYPRDKSGRVYYVPTSTGDLSELRKEDKELLKDIEFMEKGKRYMNSPTNLKCVWMNGRAAYTQWYTDYLYNGSRTKNMYQFNIGSFGTNNNLTYYAKKIYEYESITEAQRNMARAMGTKLPDRVKIEGRGFQALTHPWTCSNLEEIYFDWTLLMSEEAKIILAQHGISLMNVLQKYLINKNHSGKIERTDLPLKLFCGLNGDIKSFKRLRVIAMISNLGGSVNIVNACSHGEAESRKNNNCPWIATDAAKGYLKESQSDVWLYVNDNALDSSSVDNFTIRSYYEFDVKYLRDYFKSYVDGLKEQKVLDKASVIKANLSKQEPRGEVEVYLDNLLEKRGKDYVKQTLIISACDGNTAALKKWISDTLTSAGASKYLGILTGK